jgi:predicted TIM-barrel fold metal-dependent hydrolase
MAAKPIDVHVHPPTEEFLFRSGGTYLEAAIRRFGGRVKPASLEEMAAEYRAAGIVGIVLGWDAESSTGLPPLPNDYVAGIVRAFPDVFRGFCSVDPWKGRAAVEEIERSVRELGLIGLKTMPIAQAFFPDDRRFYPLWETCADLGIPVLFHMGTTALGSGNPGGSGLKLKYSRPIPHLDDVAADFPGLTLIGAHPGWPWEEELLAVALHKDNVYIDLSGWKPRYLPGSVLRHANTLLRDKFLFGTDYPFLRPAECLEEFGKLDLRPEARQKILSENALRILPGLAGIAGA